MRIKHLIIAIAAIIMLSGCKSTENTLSYFRNLGNTPSGVMPQGSKYGIKIAPKMSSRLWSLHRFPKPQLCLTSHRPTPLVEARWPHNLFLAFKLTLSTKMATS